MSAALTFCVVALTVVIVAIFVLRGALAVSFYREQMREYPKTPRNKAVADAIRRANP